MAISYSDLHQSTLKSIANKLKSTDYQSAQGLQKLTECLNQLYGAEELVSIKSPASLALIPEEPTQAYLALAKAIKVAYANVSSGLSIVDPQDNQCLLDTLKQAYVCLC